MVCLLCISVVAQSAGGKLTPRELQVLYLGGSGLSDGDIAAEIHCSRPTVKKHFENAFGKLGEHRRVAAARVLGLAL